MNATVIPCTLLSALLATAAADDAVAYSNAKTVFSCRFEEKDDRDFDQWPDVWRRRHGPGYPGYVKMAIEPAESPVGKSAFVIQANGSRAEIDTRPLPVDVLHAYVVEALVKTDDLRRDKVRVALDFVDEDGAVLRSWATEAEQTGGQWRRVRIGPVHLSDEKLAAAVLRFELVSNPPGDLKGRALLAEVRLLETPRLELRFDDQPEQVFFENESIAVEIHVSGVPIRGTRIDFTLEDPITKDVLRGEARLRIPSAIPHGGDGEKRGGFGGPGGAWQVGRASWELPTKKVGFYRLTAVLFGENGFQQQTQTTVAIIRPAPVPADGVFGWNLPGCNEPLPSSALQRLVLKSGIRFVKVPIWFSEKSRFGEMRPLLDFSEYLMSSGVETVGMLSDPPAELRKRLRGTGSVTAADVFCAEPEFWYASVENTFLYFGTRADYWQLGSDDSIEFCAVRDLDSRLGAVKERISSFAKHAMLGIAWNWIMEMPSDTAKASLDFVSLSADPPLAPETLGLSLDMMGGEVPDEKPQHWLALQSLSAKSFSTKTRAADLVLRMVAARRGGARRVFLPTPFSSAEGLLNDDGTPGVLYQPWRTTALSLAGKQELGSLALSKEVQNVLFGTDDKTVLIAWSERPVETPLLTGEDLVRVDAWGHREPVPTRDGLRILKTGRVPAFFFGIDPQTARVRLSFALNKDRVPSIPEKRFAQGFRFTNAFSPLAVGKIKLKVPPGWKVEDEEHAFQLATGATFNGRFAFSLPLDIVEGTYYITAEITLTAPASRKFEVRRPIAVGDDGQRFLLCGVLGEDGVLDVYQYTFNDLPRAASYNCQLFAPGRRRLTAAVTCKPYECETTVYHFENGRELLGQPITLQVQMDKDPQVFMQRLVVEE